MEKFELFRVFTTIHGNIQKQRSGSSHEYCWTIIRFTK